MHYAIHIEKDHQGGFTATSPQLPGWFRPVDLADSPQELDEEILDSIARFLYAEPTAPVEIVARSRYQVGLEELQRRARQQYEEFREARAPEEAEL